MFGFKKKCTEEIETYYLPSASESLELTLACKPEARERMDKYTNKLLHKITKNIDECCKSGDSLGFFDNMSFNEEAKKILIKKGYKVEPFEGFPGLITVSWG